MDDFLFKNINYTRDKRGMIANLLYNGLENNLRFPGQYYDSETGLYYNFHRYYEPDVGRYLREDPVESGINFYVYVGDEPVMLVDFSGLSFPGTMFKGIRCFFCLGEYYRCRGLCDTMWNCCLEKHSSEIGDHTATGWCVSHWKNYKRFRPYLGKRRINGAGDISRVILACIQWCMGGKNGCGPCAGFLWFMIG